MKYVHMKNPALQLNKYEAKRLIEYAKESYFKHLRLYEFVFNNKAPNEVKRITFKEEQARNEMPLATALQISVGRPVAFQDSALSTHEMAGEQAGSIYGTDQEAEGHDQGYDEEDMDEPMEMDYVDQD